MNANSALAYNGRGLARYYKGDLDQALADYDKVIAIEPNFAEAYGNRALSLLALGRDAQAEKDLNKWFCTGRIASACFRSFSEGD